MEIMNEVTALLLSFVSQLMETAKKQKKKFEKIK